MYTRTYTDERNGIIIPESYGGTALIDSITDNKSDADEKGKNPWENRTPDTPTESEDEKTEAAFSPLSKIQLPSFLSNIFNFDNFSLRKIGKEEILILAAAAFLFFSKEGDKELAIMLLLLLFL